MVLNLQQILIVFRGSKIGFIQKANFATIPKLGACLNLWSLIVIISNHIEMK